MATKRRGTRIESSIHDDAGMEARVGDYAAAELERLRLENEMNKKIVQIKREYEEKKAAQEGILNAIMRDIQTYVQLHPDAIPGPKKSRELLHGTIGYRTGNPKVYLPKGVEEAAVCGLLKDDDELAGFLRITETLNKEAVIAADAETRERLAEYGVEVRQTERFFVEPKIDRSGA